jgi:hypothetical protein
MVPIKTEAAAAAAAAASSTEQQVLLGPLSQAFAAPAPSETAMQLLMARLDGAAPNSPEADAALHKLLPQALRDEFAAEDVFELLAAMQLLLGGGGRRFDPAAVLAALPERLKVRQCCRGRRLCNPLDLIHVAGVDFLLYFIYFAGFYF